MKIVRLLVLCIALFATGILKGQSVKTISVETAHVSLVFSVGADGKLYQDYLGNRLSTGDLAAPAVFDKAESYIPAGGDNLFEPAIRVIHADGNPALFLKFDGLEVTHPDGNTTITSITLKDPLYPVTVVLHIAAYYKEDVLKSWTEISHEEKKPVLLTRFASSMLHLDATKYYLTQFHGDWAEEMRMQESELTSGIRILDSKLGTRANMYQTPVFFLAKDQPATETTGAVLAGTLAWTGNFQFTFDVDELNRLRIISGMNPYASEYSLDKNEKFVTPAFIFTYSDAGKGLASRHLHDWARNYGVLDGKKDRMTLLNNWEATYFDFNEQKLSGLFGDAAKLGVDMFLLDDGWFANKYPRNSDNAGLGDWEPNHTKLPHGIAHLVKDANSKGVQFGIWLEPEMVNPKSELYEKHPEWILKLPNREENYFRNQLVLDLCNPKVQDFVYGIVDNLLTENPGIAFIKWDCNRMMTNTYSPYLKDKQTEVFIDYTRGLYNVLDRLRAKYPHLPMMLCSGGGGRTDYGGLKYFTEFWPSDNTDAAERVFIQWGYSYFFPANTMAAHVTSWGKQSLKYRTDVAMMGRLGYDINLHELTEQELTFSREAIANYKRLSQVIWQGDLYRLISPYQEQRAVVSYINPAKTKAVLFSYTLHPRYGNRFTPVVLEGLDPQKKYKVEEINLMPGTHSAIPENGHTYSGDYLMKVGLHVSGNNALTSSVVEITAQ